MFTDSRLIIQQYRYTLIILCTTYSAEPYFREFQAVIPKLGSHVAEKYNKSMRAMDHYVLMMWKKYFSPLSGGSFLGLGSLPALNELVRTSSIAFSGHSPSSPSSSFSSSSGISLFRFLRVVHDRSKVTSSSAIPVCLYVN